MKLVVREYLSMLKESGELDALLPDLLLSMNIVPVSKAQVGVRQHGVDVAGVGPDPMEEGRRTLFLFTVKQGDFDRSSWDTSGDLQAVRPSLNEIKDVYLQRRVSESYRDLPKKVVLCCGGDMKQNVKDNWEGYVASHTEDGRLEYAFWGGDRLALLIEKHMLDENLFPESARKQIRKTISLVDENERPPHHFYRLARETLFDRDLPTGGGQRAIRKRQRAFRLLNLSLNIVFHWCREADNLRPALFCAERALLTAWDWMRETELFDCGATNKEFFRLFGTYVKVVNAFAVKLVPYCFVRDGFTGRGYDETEYFIRTFEAIGILGLACLSHQLVAEWFSDDSSSGEEEVEKESEQPGEATAKEGEESPALKESLDLEARGIGKALAHLIANNAAALTPCYDEHAIEISIGLLALLEADRKPEAESWTRQLARRIPFAYEMMGRYFPIATDSYEDLVALVVGNAPPKEDLIEMSTLLPILAYWHAALDLPESYRTLAVDLRDVFSETHLQMWFPGETTDEHLYRSNAGRKSGTTLAPIPLPASINQLKEQIRRLSGERREYEELSCIKQGLPILSLIASRHYRTPVLPAFWQERVVNGDARPEHAGEGP